MAYVSAATLVEELREFTAARWLEEPPDVARLRQFTLPPMGNLPCVMYCNFDLFWAGEQLQVCRQAALDGDLRLPELCSVTAMLLQRTAARTAKWEMTETVALLEKAASIMADWRPDTSMEFAVVIEHLMMAVDRVQAAVDAIIPWNELDGAVRLRPEDKESAVLHCRVTGSTVATQKADGLAGFSLLNVRPTSGGDELVAVDLVGAGEGDLVLVALGSAARELESTRGVPTDAAVVAIVDE